jgi:hypothetical protein
MDGNIEKVRSDIENREREYEIDSPEYMQKMSKLFTNVVVPMHNEREVRNSLGNKTHLDMEFGSRFIGGDADNGGQVFEQISSSASAYHNDFHFYPQKNQQNLNPNYNPLMDDDSEMYQVQHHEQSVQHASFSNPTNSNNGLPKPLIFGGLGLLTLTIGLIAYKVRKNKLKRLGDKYL